MGARADNAQCKVGHPRGAEDHEGGAEVPTNGPRKTTAAADLRVVPFATQMLWDALQPASFLRTGQPRYGGLCPHHRNRRATPRLQ